MGNNYSILNIELFHLPNDLSFVNNLVFVLKKTHRLNPIKYNTTPHHNVLLKSFKHKFFGQSVYFLAFRPLFLTVVIFFHMLFSFQKLVTAKVKHS